MDKIYNLPDGLSSVGAIDEDVQFNIVNKRAPFQNKCITCYGIILEWTGPKKGMYYISKWV